jgi:hypothetical protein
VTEHERTDRLGRRAKRFLTPLQKYERSLRRVARQYTGTAGRIEPRRSACSSATRARLGMR